jgi:hypothetical protein
MGAPDAYADEELARLHQDWQELHGRLRVQEQMLSDALALYARGEGPRPDTMIGEVEQMRAECARRFKRLMAAVKG